MDNSESKEVPKANVEAASSNELEKVDEVEAKKKQDEVEAKKK